MVCPYDIDALRQPNRNQDIKEWRQVGMVWKALEGGCVVESGRFFKKDHATVLHSIGVLMVALDGYHDSLAEKVYKVCETIQTFNLKHDTTDMNEIASAVLIERNLIEKFRKLAEL
jgi:hypothetical protein